MDVLCLLDTRMDSSIASRLCLNFPFCKNFVVLAEGHAGGLILLLNEVYISLKVIMTHPRFTHCLYIVSLFPNSVSISLQD